ncbi:MAG: hypothetical protein ACKPKO_56305, partial [Candidatus Fonsibacter sp.]
LSDKKRILGRAFAKLRNGVAKQIGFLAAPVGCITAHPAEVDKLIQEAWAPVYNGQSNQHVHTVDNFLIKYPDFIYRGEMFEVGSITGEQLMREFQHSAATAASWDQWEYREWAIIPPVAADWLTKLPNLVDM